MHKEADIQEVVESAFLPFKEVMEVSSDAVIYVVAMIEYYIYFGSIDRHTSYHTHSITNSHAPLLYKVYVHI